MRGWILLAVTLLAMPAASAVIVDTGQTCVGQSTSIGVAGDYLSACSGGAQVGQSAEGFVAVATGNATAVVSCGEAQQYVLGEASGTWLCAQGVALNTTGGAGLAGCANSIVVASTVAVLTSQDCWGGSSVGPSGLTVGATCTSEAVHLFLGSFLANACTSSIALTPREQGAGPACVGAGLRGAMVQGAGTCTPDLLG